MHSNCQLTALDAAAAIREGRLSSEALVFACLERIAERDPAVRAWAHLDPDFALRQARACDAAKRMVSQLPPLFGVPVGIKDIVDTGELPTELGSPIFSGRRPERDAALVLSLKRAGAIVLGKTVTAELAFYTPGPTRNPHDLERTPGGSSSGSAAAVADFHVPLAVGTQTAGSIIRPASYCGVVGMKPTFGRVPREGVLGQSEPLDTVGGYARSVEDVALLINAMSGNSGTSLLDAAADGGAGTRRLAFVKSVAWPSGEPAMKEAFARLVARLGSDMVEEIELPAMFDDTGNLQRLVQFHDIARNYGPLLDAHPREISTRLAEVIAEGRAVSEDEYASAYERREPLYVELTPLLARFDAILTPAAAGPAPKGLAATGSPAFNFLWTYLGMPAISVPLLEADGLPIGVQLVGARDQDARLLATARWLCECCKN